MGADNARTGWSGWAAVYRDLCGRLVLKWPTTISVWYCNAGNQSTTGYYAVALRAAEHCGCCWAIVSAVHRACGQQRAGVCLHHRWHDVERDRGDMGADARCQDDRRHRDVDGMHRHRCAQRRHDQHGELDGGEGDRYADRLAPSFSATMALPIRSARRLGRWALRSQRSAIRLA